MAKKKKRPAPASAATSTAVATQPTPPSSPTTPITPIAPPPAPAMPRISNPESQEPSFRSTALGKFCYGYFYAFASLKLAIPMLMLFAVSLIYATLLESWHDAAVAKQLVYGAWWFTLLMFLLGNSIIFAAVKKIDPKKLRNGQWPWKKHQTGFLVTHLGLITLVFGGLVKFLGGEEGQIHLIDVDDAAIQKEAGYPQTSDVLSLADQHRLRVMVFPAANKALAEYYHQVMAGEEPPPEATKRGLRQVSFSISPGALTWRDTPDFRANMTPGMKLMNFIANPFRGSKSFSADGFQLDVTNFYQTAELWPYTEAGSRDESFPAVELRVESKVAPTGDIWVTGFPAELSQDEKQFEKDFRNYLIRLQNNLRGSRAMPFAGDFLTASSPLQVKEFLAGPGEGPRGSLGQLVLYVGSDRQRFRVAIGPELKGKTEALGDTGLSFEITGFGELLREQPFAKVKDDDEQKSLDALFDEAGKFPYVRFRLHRGDDYGEFVACPRLPNLPLFTGKGKLPAPLVAFYHHPDGLYGRKAAQGAVEFLRGPDGATYFRVFGSSGTLSAAAEAVDLTDSSTIQGLPWRAVVRTSFQPIGYLPQAVRGVTAKPRNLVRIGAKPPARHGPALVGVMMEDDQEYPFQVHMLQKTPAMVFTKKNVYFLRYEPEGRRLDFEVTLHRVYDAKDPGTERSAKYHSDITITDKKTKKSERHELFMNHTVDYGGYRFFQANFIATDYDYEDKQMGMTRNANITGLTLSHDPGTIFCYIGLVTVVAGIFIMFYMKAYFFKPRGRHARQDA